MCLVTDLMDRPLIAETDITTYKALDKYTMRSPYKQFLYHRRILYAQSMQEISRGLEWKAWDKIDIHYLDVNYPDWRLGRYKNLICIMEGFHSCLDKERFKQQLEDYPSCALFEAIIPQGSWYYKNATNVIVSNQIIIL